MNEEVRGVIGVEHLKTVLSTLTPEDIVKHEPQPNKRKFNIGDKVFVKKTNAQGTVVDIYTLNYNSGKKLKYLVEFQKQSYKFSKEYYSHELCKK